MNLFLIDALLSVEHGFVATILDSQGHSYGKPGARAIYEHGGFGPKFGNLGSLCVDQEIIAHGKRAIEDGQPKRLRIDTSSDADIHLGYGAMCGGAIELLVEPILTSHRAVLEELATSLTAGISRHLRHDLVDGSWSLLPTKNKPTASSQHFDEQIPAVPRLILFGATSLARSILACSQEMDFRSIVVDWREAHLQAFGARFGVRTEASLEELGLEPGDLCLILSHSYEHDRIALEYALRQRCSYIGLLSSRKRRDRIFGELREAGIATEDVERISSPIGLDIGARLDAEIAVAIVAELVGRSHT
jgi:xanthine dehydrogenase accessory factor